MTESDQSVPEFEASRAAFVRLLPRRFEAIETECHAWETGKRHPAMLESLERSVHSLAAAADSFGYEQMSAQSHAISEQVKAWLEAGQPVSETRWSVLRGRISSLGEFILGSEVDRRSSTAVSSPSVHRVYVIEDDSLQGRELVSQLNHFGYEAQVFVSAQAAGRAVEQYPPHALIIDINLSEGAPAGFEAARALIGRIDNIPVLFISTSADFATRLEAARAGGIAYFEKPVDVARLVDRLDQLVSMPQQEPGRVLVVDDDVVLAQVHTAILRDAGMEVMVVNKPADVLAALAVHRPDVVLLDMYMPGCTGSELARLIRQQDTWLGVPIVFLSSESESNRQVEAMRSGADGFLLKPVDPERLVALTQIRIERARTLNAAADKDSLTGLLKHGCFNERLAVALAHARRINSVPSLAMIDIDFFKQVNDNHGHLTGDRVIRSLARLFKQRLRPSDIAGRYGGEEFALVLPGCSQPDAVRLVDRLRARFSELRFRHERGEFQVTFSAGVASGRPDQSAEALVHAADQALYKAKRLGRNRVCQEESENGSSTSD